MGSGKEHKDSSVGSTAGRAARHALASATDALAKIAAQADEAIDLAEAALVLASFDHPVTEMDVYRDHLRELVSAIGEQAENLADGDNAGPEEMVGILSKVIAGDFQYHGDEETYDDLDNANMMRVIERRKGLPVALGIIYLFAARAQGWLAAGLNFPGHFLIRIESRDGRRVIIDPFHDGRIMQASDLRELLKVVAGQAMELESMHCRTVSNRDILVRLQSNIKTRHLDLGRMEDALETISYMQILSPEQSLLWHEAGLMQMRLGRLKNAIESFEGFVARAPDGADKDKIAQVVRELREHLH